MHIHRYERFWIVLMIVALTIFFASVVYAAYGMGIMLPEGEHHHAVPAAGGERDWAGVFPVGPGHVEARILARAWQYTPGEIRVPAGTTVTFRLRSEDATHGFFIPGTTVNAMIIPGEETRVTYRFTQPGEYTIVCHEYCGLGHHAMTARVIVTGDAPETK